MLCHFLLVSMGSHGKSSVVLIIFPLVDSVSSLGSFKMFFFVFSFQKFDYVSLCEFLLGKVTLSLKKMTMVLFLRKKEREVIRRQMIISAAYSALWPWFAPSFRNSMFTWFQVSNSVVNEIPRDHSTCRAFRNSLKFLSAFGRLKNSTSSSVLTPFAM